MRWCLSNRKWERNMQLEKTNKNVLDIPENDLLNLVNLAKAIAYCKVDDNGSVYVKFKDSVVIEAREHIILYSKNGMLINKAPAIHFNPEPRTVEGQQSLDIINDKTSYKE